MDFRPEMISDLPPAQGSVGQAIERRPIDAICPLELANCKRRQVTTMPQHDNLHGGEAANQASHPPHLQVLDRSINQTELPSYICIHGQVYTKKYTHRSKW